MPSVVIGLPIQRGQLEPECFHSVLAARTHMYQHNIPHKVLTTECSLISASRNIISENFMNHTNGDYLFWLDSDIQFPPYGITRLVERKLDIVGGVYYHKEAASKPTIMKFNDDQFFTVMWDFPQDEVFEVDGIGTGFLLIHRDVLAKFTKEVQAEIGPPFGLGKGPNGHEEGEDLSFCRRAKKLGYKVWADPTIPLGHIGKIAYTRANYESMRDFFKWREARETYKNDIPGWMTPAELNWLHETAKEMDSIVEIGSWKGRSTHALLSGCKGIVTAVDTFKGSRGELDGPHVEAKGVDIKAEFMKNVGGFKNLRVKVSESLAAAKRFKNKSVDMVFIDGAHDTESVRADIKAWLPKAKKLICGHDYNWHSVQEAVTERFGEPDLADSIWAKRL